MEVKKQVGGRRSFIRGMLAGSAVMAGFLSSPRKGRGEDRPETAAEGEILYRETDAFREYYDSLRS